MPDPWSTLAAVALVLAAPGSPALPPPGTVTPVAAAATAPHAAPPAGPVAAGRSAADRSRTSSSGSTRTPAAASVAPRGRWVWPVADAQVLRAFDPPAVRWGAGHRGVDVRTGAGAAVRAPAEGQVAFAGIVAGRPVVALRHADGLRSTYESVVAARPVGTVVRAGEAFGVLGAGGHCGSRPCLHWGVRSGGQYLDPLSLLGRPRLVLLPTEPW